MSITVSSSDCITQNTAPDLLDNYTNDLRSVWYRKFSQCWQRRWSSSEMWHLVVLYKFTNVSKTTQPSTSAPLYSNNGSLFFSEMSIKFYHTSRPLSIMFVYSRYKGAVILRTSYDRSGLVIITHLNFRNSTWDLKVKQWTVSTRGQAVDPLVTDSVIR